MKGKEIYGRTGPTDSGDTSKSSGEKTSIDLDIKARQEQEKMKIVKEIAKLHVAYRDSFGKEEYAVYGNAYAALCNKCRKDSFEISSQKDIEILQKYNLINDQGQLNSGVKEAYASLEKFFQSIRYYEQVRMLSEGESPETIAAYEPKYDKEER
jgi:hypothetical protein